MNKADQIKQAKLNKRQIKKDAELFRFVGPDNKMVNVNILNEVYKGSSISDYLKELKEANSLIKASKSLLRDILLLNGYELQDNELKSLISQIKKMQIINPDKKYLDIIADGNYAIGGKLIEGIIIEDNEIPANFDNGCYEIVNHKLVLDEAKLKRKIFL